MNVGRLNTGTVIRLSEPEDLPVLTAIYNEAVLNSVATFDTEPKTLEERSQWFDLHRNPLYPLVSALVGGRLAGWGTLSPFHPRPAYNPTCEFSVYVQRELRGKGVGESILRDLLSRAGTLGFHSVMGLITGENLASLAMARKLGFVEAGRFREVGRKFDRWLDVVVVQYLLDSD